MPAYDKAHLAQIEALAADIKRQVRRVHYDRRFWFVGVDVCKVLGLAPSPSNRCYQSLFARLSEGERITLPDNLGGQGHKRVLIDLSGVYTLANIALQRRAKRQARLRRQHDEQELRA